MSGNHTLIWAFCALWTSVVGALAEGRKTYHKVGLEMSWDWQGGKLGFGTAGAGEAVTVTRADFLMSSLALRRADGTWLETGSWYGCFRGAEGRGRAALEGVPGQVYTGLRFQIGVEPAINKSDPNLWPAGHALHPSVNGLHWGWQGGYIFMALEGHRAQEAGQPNGFSYHLAGDAQLMTVTLDGALDLTRGGTVGIGFDVAKVLGGLNPAEFGESTHSRPGDARAETLRGRVEQAFSLTGVVPEIWQDQVVVATADGAGATRGTPWPMRISSRLPKVALPADNLPSMDGVELGRRLFHETRLSVNNTQSCASCHDQRAAFADPGKRYSLGAEGRAGMRNAMPLVNLAWQDSFFWDGRARRLRDQVLVPIQDPVEMHASLEGAVKILSEDAGYAPQFAKAFGSPGVTAERLGLALEQFLLTLVSQDSKFDQALLGREKLSAQEQRGLELFITEYDPARQLRGADCFHCHGGNLFSNQGFANNGLDSSPEAARAAVTGLAADRGKFRVPSLRNIALTAPYMHDGRFATLEEVIEHYDHGVRPSSTLDPNLAKHPAAGLALTDADKAALVAILNTLTDPQFSGTAAAEPVLTTR
jgi:cytochrome c peroxidase